MKIDRNSKKWKELYNHRLIELIKARGITRTSYDIEVRKIGGTSTWPFSLWNKPWEIPTPNFDKPTIHDTMPDHIKEAKEYADKLYEALK